MPNPPSWLNEWTPIISAWATVILTLVIAAAAYVQALASHRVAKLTRRLAELTQGQALIGLFQWQLPQLQALQATAEKLREEGREGEAEELERFIASGFKGLFGPMIKDAEHSGHPNIVELLKYAHPFGLQELVSGNSRPKGH